MSLELKKKQECKKSRAKKYLCINFSQDISNNISITISPFIRELDQKNYIGSNLTKSLSVKYQINGNISNDINNYLRYRFIAYNTIQIIEI